MGSGVKGMITALSSEDGDIKPGDEELLQNCWANVTASLSGCQHARILHG